VVAVASKLYARQHGDDDRAFANLVSHVAFIGVPFYGTISAAAALLRPSLPAFKTPLYLMD
jgi:hypothetical protein